MRSPLLPSGLVRQLASGLPEGAPVLAGGARQDLAERLGQWFTVADAIALRSAQPAMAAVGARAAQQPTPDAAALTASAAALGDELARVRATLTRSITARDPRQRPDPADLDTAMALFHLRYQDQQRRMEMSVDALRDHVRQTLAKASPRLAQLAALDALLGEMLGGREQRLLAGLPVFLKARFTRLRRASAGATAEAPPARPGAAPGWLQDFETEFEQTLLAELEHRLLPVVGMIEGIGA